MKDKSGRGLVIEVVEIAPGVVAAALFQRVKDWLGRPHLSYRGHAGGGSVGAAVRRLDAPRHVTVVQNLHTPEAGKAETGDRGE